MTQETNGLLEPGQILWISLHSADPTGGDQTSHEVTTGSPVFRQRAIFDHYEVNGGMCARFSGIEVNGGAVTRFPRILQSATITHYAYGREPHGPGALDLVVIPACGPLTVNPGKHVYALIHANLC